MEINQKLLERTIDQLNDHRTAKHGFNDPAEYDPDGCTVCDSLQRAIDKMHRMLEQTRTLGS